MSSNYSSEQINELIRENERRKRYFVTKIKPRFSDYVYDNKIHFSKLFEFFEMARFEIVHGFYNFCREEHQGSDAENLGNFVVVRINSESFEALESSARGEISVKTALIVHQKPLLEFEQTAFNENGCQLIKANIKIAIVNKDLKKAESWDRDILLAMLEFINLKGKEEIL